MNRRQEEQWKQFNHSSPLRENVLCWYPFRHTDRVLEVGCSQGALTGFLCDHCAFVAMVDTDSECVETERERWNGSCKTNLQIYQTDILCFDAEKPFDKIILMEFAELFDGNPEDLLRKLLSLLAEDGVLLFGFRNRYGIRYFGDKEDKYKMNTDGTCLFEIPRFSKKEIMDVLKKSGFRVSQCYYPLPDLIVTQMICSDDWLPADGIRDRVITYDPFGDGNNEKALLEKERLEQIVKDGMLPAFTNCFLLECRPADSVDVPASERIIGAVLSADREKGHAFSTLFLNNGTVEKRALFPEGDGALLEMGENIRHLDENGLAVVPQQHLIENDKHVIRMPYIAQMRLVDHINLLFETDPESVLPVFSMLYQDILQAGGVTDGSYLSEEGIRTKNPILKTSYIDMIPYNAFWDDGKIIYFDQEFTEENGEAKYVLYRALRYTWLHISNAEEVIPLDKARSYFGLEDLWDAYTIKEDAFTEKNRNRQMHKQFYEWAWGRKHYEVGFVMGVFDLFHFGHLRLFQNAKTRCRFLRVGVLSDELVEKYKNIHPVIPLEERIEIIKALRCVDEVVAIDGEYVSKVAEWYKRPFDCFFSGDDHIDNEYWKKEKEELNQLGAEIEFFPYTKEISSTMIRNTLHGGKDGN